MPEPTDVMITAPFYQHQQYEASRFLKNKPLALGILTILIALLGLGLTIWNKSFFVIWSPIIFIIIGAITVSAAHTRKLRLVKISQMLSYVNLVVVTFSIRGHLVYALGTPDVSFYVLVACDILIFTFSLAVAITTCSCCCRPKSTLVTVSYVTTDLPDKLIMQMGQLDPSAVTHPAAHGSVPRAPLNYGHVPNASPPMYSPVPSAPPPAYEHDDFQTRR